MGTAEVSALWRENAYKGQRSKQVVTLSGEVTLSSAYYYCPACQTGFSPSA